MVAPAACPYGEEQPGQGASVGPGRGPRREPPTVGDGRADAGKALHMSPSAVPRSHALQALAATAAVGLIPVALTAVHLPRAADAPVVQPAADPPSFTNRWIAIQTGATSSITLNNASGQIGAAQTLAPDTNCGMNQGSAATRYVTFTGSTGGAFSESL